VIAIAAIAAAWLASAPPAGADEAGPEAAPAASARPDAAAAPHPEPDAAPEIIAAFQAAEAMQGPLDGLWRLQDGQGRTLFIFSLADAGGPPAPLAADPDRPGIEGAWRDPGRAGAADGSGFLDIVRRDGGRLTIRFVAGPDGRPQILTLTAAGDGRWTGQLNDGGARRSVVMSRF
jgi:hypothetical protein